MLLPLFGQTLGSENSGYISHHLMHHLTKVALSWTLWTPKLVEHFDPVYPDGPRGLGLVEFKMIVFHNMAIG